ncbi:MAG: helix-turn-helix transcriptional regulator [Atopobiaceae bacterium]|nr:helix-turn-helix transcriptional regulator [Atopobiaceae bacterium]
MREDASSIAVRTILAENVRSLRRKAHLSQQGLADMIGMNRTYLSDIENVRGNASIDVMVKIADGLDVPVTRLLDGAEICPPYRLGK